jgi:hypothetical protein
MTSPDAAAAQPESTPTAAEVAAKNIGAYISANGVSGVLADADPHADGSVHLAITQDGQPYDTVVVMQADGVISIRDAAPAEPDAVAVPDYIVAAREMAQISDQLKASKGAVAALEDRYKELSETVMAYYEMIGDTQLRFDGRLAHLRYDTFAKFHDKPVEEGGGKYTHRDVVEVLRAIDKSDSVQPETVHPGTLATILREYRDDDKPVPEALAALVELGERPKVVIGAPARKRR